MWWVRVASALALLQGAGHGFLVMSWKPTRGDLEVAAVEAMKRHAFIFQGFSRTYWDFFYGYGLMAAFNCLVEAALLWQLAPLMTSDIGRVVPIVLLFIAANVVHAALCWKYFFITPIVFDVAVAVCLGLSLTASRR